MQFDELPSQGATYDDKWQATFTRKWRAWVDPHVDSFARFYGAGSVLSTFQTWSNILPNTPYDTSLGPIYGLPSGAYEYYAGAVAYNFNVSKAGEDDSSVTWVVSVDYRPWNPLEHTATGSIFDEPPQVLIESQLEKIPVSYDKGGNPIQNFAGDWFAPTVEDDQIHMMLRMSYNLGSVATGGANPITTIMGYVNCVNGSTWQGFAARTWWVACVKITPKYSQFDAQKYWVIDYELHWNPNTFDPRVRQEGFNYLDGSGNKHRILIDGQPSAAAEPLTSSGGVMAPGGTPLYTTFEIKSELDFDTAFSNFSGIFF